MTVITTDDLYSTPNATVENEDERNIEDENERDKTNSGPPSFVASPANHRRIQYFLRFIRAKYDRQLIFCLCSPSP